MTNKKPKKKEKYREEYRKERKRVTNYISYMRRKGFNTEGIQLPSIPDRVTKRDINKMKNLTSAKLKKEMYFFNPFTGEFVDAVDKAGVKRVQSEFLEESKKTGIYDIYIPEEPLNMYDDEGLLNMKIVENFLDTIYTLGIPNTEQRMRKALIEMFEKYKFEDIAYLLEKAANSGNRLRVNINYPDSLNVMREISYLRETMELLPIVFDEEDIYDMEQSYKEYYEDNEWSK